MPAPFTPLVSQTPGTPTGNPERFRLKVLSGIQAAGVGAGLTAKGRSSAEASNKAACRGEPSVEVERAGDRVERIRVRCSCGQVLELSCVY